MNSKDILGTKEFIGKEITEFCQIAKKTLANCNKLQLLECIINNVLLKFHLP